MDLENNYFKIIHLKRKKDNQLSLYVLVSKSNTNKNHLYNKSFLI